MYYLIYVIYYIFPEDGTFSIPVAKSTYPPFRGTASMYWRGLKTYPYDGPTFLIQLSYHMTLCFSEKRNLAWILPTTQIAAIHLELSSHIQVCTAGP